MLFPYEPLAVVKGTKEGHTEIVRLLLADGTISDVHAEQALNIAIKDETQGIIDLLF
jgi:hypothetical protein